MIKRSLWLSVIALGLLAVGFLPGAAVSASPLSPTDTQETSNPLATVSVGPVHNGWQAHLELSAKPEALQVKLNGKRANHLFIPGKGTQDARLAPDDGLRYGRNVLEVIAVSKGRTYPTETVIFRVERRQPLASAGRDQAVRVYSPVRLDGRRTRNLSLRKQMSWRIVRAPEGSKAQLLNVQSLRTGFTPDVNGAYQIELTIRDRKTGAVGRDLTTVSVYPNYPPIGIGIETMAAQPDKPWGNWEIKIGTNCAPDILGCPPNTLETLNQVRSFPYLDGYPVQLLILDRKTLEVLNEPGQGQRHFKGNSGDVQNIINDIRGYSAGPVKPLVILTALPTDTLADFTPALQTIISTAAVPWVGFSQSGWSAVGIYQEVGARGPYGNLNTGGDDIGQANLKGYLQQSLYLSQTGSAYVGYNFVAGGYAAFNTAKSATPTTNEMLINGVTYEAAPLPGGCTGGFQLVVLDARTLQPSAAMPVNQTFSTNCGATDTSSQIEALASNLNTMVGSGEFSQLPLSVFLQSIGTPIAPCNDALLATAAAQLSVPIEQLGGVADAFNKSIEMGSCANPGTPGYAMAGSNMLLNDAPTGAQIGVYAPEASGSAPGMAGQPVFLEGLLQLNYLWRYAPVAGAAAKTLVGELPAAVYQPSVTWPHSTKPGEQDVLECISSALGLTYVSGSACYTPAFNNVRAAYCDPAYLNKRLSNASACASYIDYVNVMADLKREFNALGNVNPAITQYTNLYQDAGNKCGGFCIQSTVQEVVTTLTDTIGTSRLNLKVAGFWTGLVADAIKLAATLTTGVVGLGVVGALGSLAAPVMVAFDGSNDLGPIVNTTGNELAKDMSSSYYQVGQQFGTFGDILASDSGKLAIANTLLIDYNGGIGEKTLIANMQNAIQRYAYGRLLGAIYQGYGLIPDSQNPSNPGGGPSNYECSGGWSSQTPFQTDPGSKDLSYVDFTFRNGFPNLNPPVPTLPVYGAAPGGYGGAPFFLVIAYNDGGYMNHVVAPPGLMRPLFEANGLGEWPAWFFRHNFRQVGWHCSGENMAGQ